MKNYFKAIILCTFFASSANAGMFDKTLVRSELRVLEFNDFAEKYLGKPSTIYIWGKKKKQTLQISYEPYNIASLAHEPYLMFVTKHIETYIAHIQKYLKWAAMATENGDSFEKDIGKAKSQMGLGHKYSFWSGNATNHYLHVQACSLGSCGKSGNFYFDEHNATVLLNLLNDLKNGSLPAPDVGNKYD